MKKLILATALLLPLSAMSMTLDKSRLYMGVLIPTLIFNQMAITDCP